MHSVFRRVRDDGPTHTAAAPSTENAAQVIRFTCCRLLRDHALRSGEDLWVCGGVVVDPQELFWKGRTADMTIDCGGLILAPGFIELQLNGGWGVDFSTPGPDLANGLQRVAQRLLAHGVTAFLPTVITSSPDNYRAILPQLVPTTGSAHGAAVLGVHLEGPFLSPEKPGCHPLEHIIAPDGQPNALSRACGAHTSHIRLVTLAPERPGATMLISELTAQNVLVAAGHSMATASEMEAAQAAGVRMCTHLFNAMPAFHPLEPGIIGVLGSPVQPIAYFGLIADGVHVHPASVKIAATVRPDSVVLVSDAMIAMGLPEGRYSFGEVGDVDVVGGDRVYRAGTSTLAGAVVPLDECVRRFHQYAGCTIVAALEAASLHPAQALGIDAKKGCLEPGADADFVLLDDNLQVRHCYIAGERVWPAANGPEAVAKW